MSARCIVLLHGWGLTPAVWDEVRVALPPGLAVRAPALPGHGDAAPAPAADIDSWIEALLPAIPEGALVCGWSLGGLLALALARRHQDRIARLVLVGTSPCFVARSDWPHALDAAIVRGFTDDFDRDSAATLRRFIALQALGDARRRMVNAGLAASLAAHDVDRVRVLADGLKILADTDLRGSLSGIHQPVQVVHGAADALMPVEGARWLARELPRAQVTVIDGCGHAPLLSHAADLAALIVDALRD